MVTWVITGGAGFIGSNLVRLTLSETDVRVVVLDKLTYAGHRRSLLDVEEHPRFAFVQGDIADETRVRSLLAEFQPAAVLNLAAESHVDRSIDGPGEFLQTNTVGTHVLLQEARRYRSGLGAAEQEAFRFLHVSTDEVYGSLGAEGLFSETTPYSPNSPYAATKAAADHLVQAYHETYRLPTLITNCSNNFGPYQFPEKLIPLMVLNAAAGEALPIFGDGLNVRDWIYVEDHCRGILQVLAGGRPGQKYNIGGGNEHTNLDLVDGLCRALEERVPAASNPALQSRGIQSYTALKVFVTDRPGHDRRYAIDAAKIRAELGWQPQVPFAAALERTVAWYLEHREWCQAVQGADFHRQRLGLAETGP